ncbi:exodeoxyribonuclease I subunit C [Tepidicella xavieri]|uniref:Exodeoxyribonuclease I n=2 Tax=Tepidicella xavieri TaxID=360241 RepID=A0A4R6UEV4_9BURK|nr:exodeoxyribonuclease I subunit C [Tepidicella xavieri]
MEGMSAHTFLWHDYETFGAHPRLDRPAQFAAIRTDADLNEVGEPVMLYCQPSADYLPDPQSCLITGITPQWCMAHGVPERAFAARIEAELARPGTIGVGYNTIRFDDEFTRFLFWRNLMDPYAREWQNGCGRWDLLDVVRLSYALRPEGIEWPKKADGRPSFRLEDLARANGLAHEAAHDALSDVRATIAVARLIRQHHPRLFEFALSLHRKERVAAELGLPVTVGDARPFLHVSGMFAPERGCLAVMWPLATHPMNRNELLAWDLSFDPRELADLDAAAIRQRLFTRQEDLPAGVQRLPIKSVHLNKSPMVVSQLRTLRPALAERWGIDMAQCLSHAAHAAALPDMSAIWAEVFERSSPREADDPEQDLYGGFLQEADRRRLDHLRAAAPADPAWDKATFDDPRLPTLVFRYRARHFPETLSDAQRQQWLAHCQDRLLRGQGGALTVQRLFERIDALAEDAAARGDERAEAILSALYDYAESLTEGW